MPIIQQFFFMLALNGISGEFELFSKLRPSTNGLLRLGLSISYTLIGSLCIAGYIWAFKESWDVNGNQFALTWIVMWLYMHVNFLLVDILTTWVPMQFMPFCILTWVVMNVASAISPFELDPGFYRWGYALPGHEVYQVLVKIWSHGCGNQLHIALPVLFSWWFAAIALVIVAVRTRCRKASAAEKAETATEPSEEAQRQTDSAEADSARRSSAVELVPQRTRTIESIRLEREAYGPSYPPPIVRGQPAR
ncbi:hypothetical protein TruAng_003309 [Truncatella angustata]|nr:hypothetical protein TruAng_003309 [Truncatella angustata]